MATKPTTPKGRSTRQSILSAGARVFTRDGYVDTRMSDVALEAGLSLGGLYRYFENKEDLFASVIEDLHEELYEGSVSSVRMAEDPQQALFEANLGYLSHYNANRGVMKAFIEATTVEERFREIWWTMRERHVARFLHSIARHEGISLDGLDPVVAARAMASLVEQVAYTNFAHHSLNPEPITPETAAKVVTRAWVRTFFAAT